MADAEDNPLALGNLPALRRVVRMGTERTPGMLNFDDISALAGPAHRGRVSGVSERLDPDDRRTAVRYLEVFFADIETDERAARRLFRSCRTG